MTDVNAVPALVENVVNTATMTAMFDLERRLTEKVDSNEKVMAEKLSNKVSFSIFTWVLGVLMLIVLGIQGIIWVRVESTNTAAQETKETVIRLETTMNNLNFKTN